MHKGSFGHVVVQYQMKFQVCFAIVPAGFSPFVFHVYFQILLWTLEYKCLLNLYLILLFALKNGSLFLCFASFFSVCEIVLVLQFIFWF